MPSIIGIAGTVPRHTVSQDEVRALAETLFRHAGFDVRELLPVFANSSVRTRHLCVDLAWFRSEAGFAERSRVYREEGAHLAERAAVLACERAGVSPRDIDHLFFVSTTGIATPGLDAHLFNRLNMKPGLLRSPLWGLGCGGGIAGLARAADWLKGHSHGTVLVVSLELCSLTFLRSDLSRSNFVATALFGDGCAAAVLAGDAAAPALAARGGPGLTVAASGAVTWKDTLDVMGWEVEDRGLKVVFSRDIPDIVTSLARPAVDAFLKQNGLALADVHHFLAHPGGTRVIAAYAAALGLSDERTAHMRAVLADCGNMSSATVLFVLERFLHSGDYRPGDLVLSAALGPGFFSEMLLARCR